MKEQTSKKQKILWSITGILIVLIAAFAVWLYRSHTKLSAYERQFAPADFVPEVPEFEIYLPETIYVTEGMTMEIYNSQVTSLGEEIKSYNVLWRCKTGKNMARKFSVTAEEDLEESYELSMEIYDNNLKQIKKETCVLKIVKPKGDFSELAGNITEVSLIPEECLPQVKICVDTKYNGTLADLKPEGITQMQDIVYAVRCGIE